MFSPRRTSLKETAIETYLIQLVKKLLALIQVVVGTFYVMAYESNKQTRDDWTPACIRCSFSDGSNRNNNITFVHPSMLWLMQRSLLLC
ncbi:hypothetical protein NQ318_014565 [Aromia moschata]|uniref:Uncharacterized protein n=1 Tax=Aromia moschata TaxID=1265417 RepID=A0AAV8XZQ6_9CUCU|nr:hypothetical protein NQ318_014565 [Aromia moschata]